MSDYQIREGWAVAVPDGYGNCVPLGVFIEQTEAVEQWRAHGLCQVFRVKALTIGDDTFILESEIVTVGAHDISFIQCARPLAVDDIAKAAHDRLYHRQRKALGLDYDPELAAQEPPPPWIREEYERRQLCTTVLTKPEAEALGFLEEVEGNWDEIMESERKRQEDRRAEIEAHPLIGRVFVAESNAEHRKDDGYTHTYAYVVHAYDAKSGKYVVHSHGKYSCLTPGALGENLLYSAEEIEAAKPPTYQLDDRTTYEYDDEGHPYVPYEREVHARIVDHREKAS